MVYSDVSFEPIAIAREKSGKFHNQRKVDNSFLG